MGAIREASQQEREYWEQVERERVLAENAAMSARIYRANARRLARKLGRAS